MTSLNTYNPDYIVPTGWILEEYLEEYNLSQSEFAKLCGRSPKLISEIISGKASVEPNTAIEFERVLGMDASLWLNLENSYRLSLAKEADKIKSQENISWAKQFPIKNMKELGIITKDAKNETLVNELLKFLGLGNIKAWTNASDYIHPRLMFKKQDNHKLSIESLFVWLKLSDKENGTQMCKDYNQSLFLKNLKIIRELSKEEPKVFYPEMKRLCNEAGVYFNVLPQLNALPLSGVTRWKDKNPSISMTIRFKMNDHFWFSFFHEAAHVLLHGKKKVFLDFMKPQNELKEEKEANIWASNFLIPENVYYKISVDAKNTATIKKWAKMLKIHEGIIVGRLQHEKEIPFSHLNSLKQKFSLNYYYDN